MNEFLWESTTPTHLLERFADQYEADVIVAAMGLAHFVKKEMVRPGATVIDVGINRVESGDGKYRLVGDVDYAAASERAGAITPVPGGVGAMTIACLMRNTLIAAASLAGTPPLS